MQFIYVNKSVHILINSSLQCHMTYVKSNMMICRIPWWI